MDWARRLNTHDNNEFGTRGRELKEYNDIVVFENKYNSARVKYLDKIYTESVLFLNVIEYIHNGDIENAKSISNLITDSKLKDTANIKIKK